MSNKHIEMFFHEFEKFSNSTKNFVGIISACVPTSPHTVRAYREKLDYVILTLNKLKPGAVAWVSEPGLEFINGKIESFNKIYPTPESADTQVAYELLSKFDDIERAVATVEWEIFNGELEALRRARENNEKFLYENLVLKLSSKFKSRLDEVWGGYNFDLGPDFEIAICEVLRSFLPARFGVCRGFVVSSDGQREGDDIIIYDAVNFPTLRFLTKTSLAGKEQIPIEAVYAYIEAKHTLTISQKEDSTFSKALQQISKVKSLVLSRKKRGLIQNDPYVDPFAPYTYLNANQPINTYRNPVFCMIMAKNVEVEGKELSETKEIITAISHQLKPFVGTGTEVEGILAGPDIYASIGIVKGRNFYPTRFVIEREINRHEVREFENRSFGMAMVHLFASIDWIKLSYIPWGDIYDDAFNK